MDANIINLLLVVEIISIIIATIVIALELWIHKSTVVILKRMNHFSKEMDTYISKQMGKIDEHTRLLDKHVEELDEHTVKIEGMLKRMQEENKSIYERFFQSKG